MIDINKRNEWTEMFLGKCSLQEGLGTVDHNYSQLHLVYLVYLPSVEIFYLHLNSISFLANFWIISFINFQWCELKPPLLSLTDKYICPNYDCNSVFTSCHDFFRHSVECPICVLCVDCKLTFTSEHEYDEHECLANDEMFRTRSLNMWLNQVGNFVQNLGTSFLYGNFRY